MTEDQLLRLVRLATGTSDSAWSSHAVSCLLQDLLEGTSYCIFSYTIDIDKVTHRHTHKSHGDRSDCNFGMRLVHFLIIFASSLRKLCFCEKFFFRDISVRVLGIV